MLLPVTAVDIPVDLLNMLLILLRALVQLILQNLQRQLLEIALRR